MGFVKGEKVTVIKNAPLHDPIEYKLMDGHISLRRSEARLIEVVCTSSIDQEGYNGTFTEDEIAREISEKSRTINIALVGNPNCGKTSFFNRATGLRERVGNYSGVTVDARTVDVHIRRLREKIEMNPSEPKYVHTKWGVGYYFQD